MDLQSICDGPPGPIPIPLIIPGGTPFIRFWPFFIGGGGCPPNPMIGIPGIPGIPPGPPIPIGPRCSGGNCPFRCWDALPLPFPLGAVVGGGIISAGVSGGESTIIDGSGMLGGNTGLRASFRRVRDFMGNLARQVEQTGVGLQNTIVVLLDRAFHLESMDLLDRQTEQMKPISTIVLWQKHAARKSTLSSVGTAINWRTAGGERKQIWGPRQHRRNRKTGQRYGP